MGGDDAGSEGDAAVDTTAVSESDTGSQADVVAALDVVAGGLTISSEIRSRLSPLVHELINFHGRYPIVRSHGDGSLRPLRDPAMTDE